MEKEKTNALIWLRDKFGEWIAGTTAFSFMWVAIGCAVGVLFVWDGVWATHQAPEGMELSYRAAGWALRFWVVFALVGVVALYKKGAWGSASSLLVTWLLASIMTYGHAVGFMATGQMQRYNSAQVVSNVETVVSESVDTTNAEYDKQIEGLRADRDADVAALESSLKIELEDGNSRNDDAAREKYTALITERRQKATQDIAAINALKVDGLKDKRTAMTEAKSEEAEQIAFDPLYVWIAHALHGEKATDSQIRAIAARVGAFWAFLVELLAGAGPAILYAAHAHFASKEDMPEYSEDGVTISRDRYEDLVQREENAKKGGKKAANTRRRGRKIEVANTYYAEKLDIAEGLVATGMTRAEATQAAFSHPFSVVKDTIRPYISDERHAAFFGTITEPDEVEDADDNQAA